MNVRVNLIIDNTREKRDSIVETSLRVENSKDVKTNLLKKLSKLITFVCKLFRFRKLRIRYSSNSDGNETNEDNAKLVNLFAKGLKKRFS